jgi:hypothetical protein
VRTVPLASAFLCLFAASTAAVAQEPAPAVRAPAPRDEVPAAPPPAAAPAPPPPAAPAALPAAGDITFEPAPPPRDTEEPVAPKKTGDFHLDVGAATDFPISLGGQATAELPGRVLLQLGLGFMPQPYAYSIDSFLVAVHAYDANVSQLVRSALGNSFVLRASGGWRPFRDHGLELYGGYTMISLGGSASPVDVINTVLAESGSSDRVSGNFPNVGVGVTMHSVHATLGWRWLLANDHFVLRAALSYIQCLAATANVTVQDPTGQSAAMTAGASAALSGFLGPFLTGYGKAPVASLSASYRF